MRPVYYLSFGIAFFGAQACAPDPPAPPAFQTDSAKQSGQATGDNGTNPNGDGSDPGEVDDTMPSDPGADDPDALAPTPGSPLDPAACSVTFAKDVLPKIQKQWRCGASACHGNPTVNQPVMDTTNAEATYTLLTTFVHQGQKLVNAGSTNEMDSALYCMMQGTCGVRMPQQGVDAGDLALVKVWLQCNAPKD